LVNDPDACLNRPACQPSPASRVETCGLSLRSGTPVIYRGRLV